VARALDDALDPGSEAMLHAQADVVMLLARGCVTPHHLRWKGAPSARTIETDIATPTMSRSRAAVYSAVFDHVRSWLPELQAYAAALEIDGGITVEKALRPWLRAPDKSSLHGYQYQNAREALSRYVGALRAEVADALCGAIVNEAAVAANERRAVRASRFADERKAKEAARLSAALELHGATRATVRQLLRAASLQGRRHTPLSDGEAAIALHIYRERLDAPLPPPRAKIDALTIPEARRMWLQPPGNKR
jgi:hypothetical protein